MRLLITGAAGMLGTDVVAAAQRAGHDVVARTRGELDITDADAVRHGVLDARPGAIVNCAAWTDVDGAEAAEDEATAVNGSGAGLLARAASDAGALLVQVSTDYVFAGDATEPYLESAAVGPATAYGRSKLAGEQAVREGTPRSAVVRTSWVFGPAGRNFVDTMRRLAAERDEVFFFYDKGCCEIYTVDKATLDGVADTNVLYAYAQPVGYSVTTVNCSPTGYCVGNATQYMNRAIRGSSAFVVELSTNTRGGVSARAVANHASAFYAAAAASAT